MSADPRVISNAKLIEHITHREARELGNGGSGLLHRDVIRILGETGIPTYMRNTFGTSLAPGTVITRTRDNWEINPIIAVTGRPNMRSFTVYRQGMQERTGATTEIYELLGKRGVPYEDTATGTDAVSIYALGDYSEQINEIGEQIELSNRENLVTIRKTSQIHIVGEGIARSSTKSLRLQGKVALALSEITGIEYVGTTGVANGAALTYYVGPQNYIDALKAVHDVIVN